MATFVQAFLIVFFVHWVWHRFDISLDAVIKYFACGFIITTSTAICFELLESVFFNVIFYLLAITVETEDEQNDEGYGSSFIQVFEGSFGLYSTMGERKRAFQQQYPLVGVLFLFCSAYLIAALVEESCKYFGFKMIEHPDFVSDNELETARAMGVFDADDDDEQAPFECGGGFECGDIEDELEVDARELANPTKQTISRFIDDEVNDEHQPLEQKTDIHPCPQKSLCATGAAITVAMVSVALGFATCENLMYIFFYNSGPLDSEIAVLISRSLFPVHPLCAGMLIF